MSVPETLSGWTYEVVDELCKIGKVESDRHDFKAALPDADTLTKLCCAFANSKGGFVVLGVKEPKSGKRFVAEGIDPDIDVASNFGQKLRANPTVLFEVPRSIAVPRTAKLLYVFSVPRSPERPHAPSDLDKLFFWKRTNTGCELMTLEEIRGQFLNYEERREKLKLLFIELLLDKGHLQELQADLAPGNYCLKNLDSSALDRLLVDTYSLLQQDVHLVGTLITLRENIRVINTARQIFFGQVALPLSNHQAIIQDHHRFLRAKAGMLLPLIDQALNALEGRFGLRNPFEQSGSERGCTSIETSALP